MSTSCQSDIRQLRDENASYEVRAQAALRLGSSDADESLDAVLEAASAADVVPEVAEAAGVAAARILLRSNRVMSAPLANFSGPAYLAFDRTVAESQRG